MIRIVSDSSTLYSVKEGRGMNVDIAPLFVTIKDKTYKELEEIDANKLVEIIKEGYLPTSSQPSIGEVIEIYNKYPEDEIINISMADGLSGTYNSACAAKNMDENPERIDVINSKTLCGPHRYLVEVAANMAKEGKGRKEIKETIESLANSSISFLIPKDFDYLVRGGRLSPLVGKIGGAIKLVPVLILSEDGRKLEKFTIKRTLKKAIGKICDKLIESGVDGNYKIYISHASNEALAEEVKTIVKESIKDVEVEVVLLSPAFITHGGPDCVAVQAIRKI